MSFATEKQLTRLAEVTGRDWAPLAAQVTRGQASGLVAVYALVKKGRCSLESFALAVRKFFPDFEGAPDLPAPRPASEAAPCSFPYGPPPQRGAPGAP
jgi:hypothetical protein